MSSNHAVGLPSSQERPIGTLSEVQAVVAGLDPAKAIPARGTNRERPAVLMAANETISKDLLDADLTAAILRPVG